MSEPSTRERLLDAAEALVAANGYANTSLREITAKAGANLAAVNYHFGSKEGLASAMLERRLTPLNKERTALLDKELEAAVQENRRPNAAVLLRAFIEPAIRFFQSEAGGKDFLRLFSRIHADPDDTIRHAFVKHMVPLFLGFYSGLKKALPQVPADVLAPRIFFCIGAMGQGAGILVDDDLCQNCSELGLPPMLGSEAMVEELIAFVTRGMEAQCDV
jgi:AcrR family transcriptional regulator